MQSMTKADLVADVAKTSGLTRPDAEVVVQTVLWPLYRVGGVPRGRYRIVPGYAKEAAGFWRSKVRGYTFKLPIFDEDAGKEVEIILVSAKPIKRAQPWLVSDPLPYRSKLYPLR